MRDITLEDTFYHHFTTRAFATGIPTTLGGTPVLSVYEDASITQITAGVSVTADLDSVTGLNLATIVATAANGYEAGKSYAIVVTTGTVGGVSVIGEVVGHFTVASSAAAVDLANGTDGLGALATLVSTVDTVVDGIQTDLDNGTDGLGALATLISTVDTVVDGIQTDLDNGTDGLGALATLISTVDTVVDGIQTDLSNATDGLGAIKTDTAAILVDTGTTLDGKINTIDTNVDAILVDTAEIGAAGAGLTDLGGMSTGMKAEVNIEVDGAFTTTMADSVATDGSIATREQALYQVLQFLTERAVSGTTCTIKKVDGSTTLFTTTLNDATTPTSITRS